MKRIAKEIGSSGEALAVKFLKSKKYLIHTTNYFTRYGEIDIIAEKDGVLAFIEVKSRATSKFGRPSEYVTPQKQQKIISAAEYYVYNNDIEMDMRFDVIEILTGEGTAEPKNYINHIKDAFNYER